MPPPATPNLPTPDFTFDPSLPGACIAGVRPYRNGSYRLDAEAIAEAVRAARQTFREHAHELAV